MIVLERKEKINLKVAKPSRAITRIAFIGLLGICLILTIGVGKGLFAKQLNPFNNKSNETGNINPDQGQPSKEQGSQNKPPKEDKPENQPVVKPDSEKDESSAIKLDEDSTRKSDIPESNAVAVDVEDVFKQDGKKVAFLTFDDGPTPQVTPKILDVLKQYQVKATFFVIGNLAEQHKDLIQREFNEKHAIGNHSYSHIYKKIYQSAASFTAEVEKTDQILKSILGSDFKTRLFRFPGGSFEKYKQPYKKILASEGYCYIDWNALSGDAEGSHSKTEAALLESIKATVKGKEHVVILMHDAAALKSTPDVLPSVISYLRNEGYEFKIMR